MLLTILISIITLNFYLNNCGKKTELIMASCNFNVAPKLFYLPKTGKTGKKPAKPSQNRIKHFKNQRKLRLLVGMRTRGVQLNAAVMAQERGASSSSRMRARSPSPPAIPSSNHQCAIPNVYLSRSKVWQSRSLLFCKVFPKFVSHSRESLRL